ncbi:MAG: hypothetical protein P1V20_19300 [Verrucomicrobiales bacterium]|nr:hypothetical protein [Verrucomicrobiales bacterium]
MPQSREYQNAKRKLKRHIDSIAASDEDVARAVAEVGYPEPRIRAKGFETFLSIIISQQVSTEAATSIRTRVFSTLGQVSPRAVLETSIENLRAAGMSGRKIEYAKGLAESIEGGVFDPDELLQLSDEEAIEKIVALRGFGRWSAEIYLMFSLQRPDIFAADDLALLIALQKLRGLPAKPAAGEARRLTGHWAPRRTAGSLFLWHYYRGAPD